MQLRTLVRSVALAAALLAPAARAHAFGDACLVKEVYAFSHRVHVKCGVQSFNGIEYYAVPTSSAAEAARFTTMASMALGGWMWVDWEYWDTTTGPAFGCQAHDCRRALSWQLLP